jgi:hypothetical protein
MSLARSSLAAAAAIALLALPRAARAQDTCAASYESAQELRRAGELVRSRAELRLCERSCPGALAADCTRWQLELDGQIASVSLAAEGADGAPRDKVRVSIDGAPLVEAIPKDPVEIDPGRHVLRFEDETGARAEATIEIAAGEKSRPVKVRFPAPAKPATQPAPSAPPLPAPSPRGPWILLGVGGLGLAAGAVLGIVGQVQRSDLEASCAPNCKKARVDPIAAEWEIGAVSAGVGAAAAGAALVWWLAGKSPPKAAAGFVLLPGPGSISVRGSF